MGNCLISRNTNAEIVILANKTTSKESLDLLTPLKEGSIVFLSIGNNDDGAILTSTSVLSDYILSTMMGTAQVLACRYDGHIRYLRWDTPSNIYITGEGDTYFLLYSIKI